MIFKTNEVYKKSMELFLLSDHIAPAYVDPSQVGLSFSVPY
jgi:hypothetical protein